MAFNLILINFYNTCLETLCTKLQEESYECDNGNF